MNEVATIERKPRSVLIDMADHFGMEPKAFEATVRATCIKPDKNGRVASQEEFAAFLLVAKQYGLNPLTKEVFAFAQRGGGIVPIVSIDGWANLINSHPQFDGMKYIDTQGENSGLVSITCLMFRKDRTHATEITEYMSECRRDTDVWKQWPRRMLRHKATIQAARMAFGFAGIYDPDEGERIMSGEGDAPRALRPPAPPTTAIEHKPALPTIETPKSEPAILFGVTTVAEDEIVWDDPAAAAKSETAAELASEVAAGVRREPAAAPRPPRPPAPPKQEAA